MAFFSEYQFDILYRQGKQMQVPDAISWKLRAEEDIPDLLQTKEGDTEPSMAIWIPTKEGKFQKVMFTLHSKSQAKTKGLKFPEVIEIPPVFEYQGDPDYGQFFKTLKE